MSDKFSVGDRVRKSRHGFSRDGTVISPADEGGWVRVLFDDVGDGTLSQYVLPVEGLERLPSTKKKGGAS